MTRLSSNGVPRSLGVSLSVVAVLVAMSAAAFAGGSARTGFGVLQVTTDPTVSAQIRVGDTQRNTATLSGLDLPAGTHRVCVSAVPGYLPPPCETVEIADGRVTHVTLTFTPAGTLDVRTEPADLGTTILVDGVARDVDRVRIAVASGERHVCFSDVPGRRTPECRMVDVPPGVDVGLIARFEMVGPDNGGSGASEPGSAAPREPASPPEDELSSNDPVGTVGGGSSETRSLCPASQAGHVGFADVPASNAHAAAIACARQWGVVTGVAESRFAPQRPLTRGQAASMVWRLIDRTSDRELLPLRVRFPDVERSVHREAIENLAGLGVVGGRTDGRFDPDATVRRDQLATMLVSALEVAYALEHAPGAGFEDLPASNVHATNVRRLAALDIAHGDAHGRFRPAAEVSRAQMASFLVRSIDVAAQRGGLEVSRLR